VKGKKYIIELKTINSMQFNIVANVKRQPLPKHIKQIQLYMHLSKIHEGFILYFGKDDSEVHYFEQSYDKTIVDAVLKDLELTRIAMKTRTVPERTVCETRSCARAKKCPVRDICFTKGGYKNEGESRSS
jgi:hypothetical protein